VWYVVTYLQRITFGTNGGRKPRATTYQRFTSKTAVKMAEEEEADEMFT